MIEVVIDPAADDAFDIREVEHHATFIERIGFDRDDGSAVVSVQKTAFAGIVQEPMAVAEVNLAGYLEHGILAWLAKAPPQRPRNRIAWDRPRPVSETQRGARRICYTRRNAGCCSAQCTKKYAATESVVPAA